MDRDEGLPISVRLAMCPDERERDPSSCRESGLTPELPVHVVLVPPLWWLRKSYGFYLCRPPNCLVDASLVFFCNTGGIQARTFIRRTNRNEVKQHTPCCVWCPRHRRMRKGDTISFMFRYCESCRSFALVFTMLTNELLNSMAARATRGRPRHECDDDGLTSVPC